MAQVAPVGYITAVRGRKKMRHPFQVGDLVRAALSKELGIVVKLNPEYVPRKTFDVKWLSADAPVSQFCLPYQFELVSRAEQ